MESWDHIFCPKMAVNIVGQCNAIGGAGGTDMQLDLVCRNTALEEKFK